MKKLILLTAALLTLTSCVSVTVLNDDPISDISDTEPARTENPSEESESVKPPKESTTEKSLAESTVQPPENSGFQSAEVHESTAENLSLYCILTQSPEFDTPEEYYGCGEGVPDCYLLKDPPDNAELKKITYNEQVYVSADYYVPLDEKYDGAQLDEYSIERLTSIFCKRYIWDGEKSLKMNVLDKNKDRLEKLEINGREYYYTTEWHSVNFEGEPILLGYEVDFLEDGNHIFIHIPPLAPIENMSEYLEAVRAER